MTSPHKSRRDDIYWIKRNTEKKKRKSETTALDDWASEGGSAAKPSQGAMRLKDRKRFICYYQRSVQHDNSHHGHQ